MTDPAACPTALELATALRNNTSTAERALETCFARIDAREPVVGAWIVLDREGALAAAREVDRARALGDKLPPLAGIPIAVKDNIDTADLPTS